MRLAPLVVLAACASNTLGPAGSSVTLYGRISDTPKQSIAFARPGEVMEHVDVDDQQVVVIWPGRRPVCPDGMEIVGVVRIVNGRTKRPGSDEPYSEKVVDVQSSRCVVLGVNE